MRLFVCCKTAKTVSVGRRREEEENNGKREILSRIIRSISQPQLKRFERDGHMYGDDGIGRKRLGSFAKVWAVFCQSLGSFLPKFGPFFFAAFFSGKNCLLLGQSTLHSVRNRMLEP
jgi:hypothetical protein